MSDLLCVARLKIHHGKLDEFKHLAARCVELVRTPGLCSTSCTSTATTQSVLSLSAIVTRRPSLFLATRGADLLASSPPLDGLAAASCALTFCRPALSASICFCWRAIVAAWSCTVLCSLRNSTRSEKAFFGLGVAGKRRGNTPQKGW